MTPDDLAALDALASAIDRDGVRSLDDALTMAAAITSPDTGDVEWLMRRGCDVIDRLAAEVRRLRATITTLTAERDAALSRATAAEARGAEVRAEALREAAVLCVRESIAYVDLTARYVAAQCAEAIDALAAKGGAR